MSEEAIVRFIALYLPQFHPTPENDERWGKDLLDQTSDMVVSQNCFDSRIISDNCSTENTQLVSEKCAQKI